MLLGEGGRGGSPVHYLYGYVPPNGVVILKILVQNRVSISEAFSRISNARKVQFCKQPFEIIRGQIAFLLFVAFKNTVQCVNKQTVILLLHPKTEYKNLAHFQNGVSILGEFFVRTGCQFGVLDGTYPPKKYPSINDIE